MSASIFRAKILTLALGALCAALPLPAAAADAHYVVRKGDTLTSIAERFGLRSREVAALNGLESRETLAVGQDLLLPAGNPLPVYYVRKGDTLDSIAGQFDTTIKELVRRNRLTNPNGISVGQKITLPRGSGPVPASSGPASSPAAPAPAPPPAAAATAATAAAASRDFPKVWAVLDRAAIAPRRWRYVVVHHSASVQGNPAAIDHYHRDIRHMENGLAYHFVIGNGHGMPDGQIAIGNRWMRQLDGGHLASEDLNRISIGICLIGNFDNSSPTRRQMESLRALTRHLLARCALPVSCVRTHRQINTKPTECPGTRFPTARFIASLQAR